jgi:hypothetical protein
MKMLEPDFNLPSIAVRRRKPNPWFRRGTVYRAALEVLRNAPAPMTAREIAEAMLVAKGTENLGWKWMREMEATPAQSLEGLVAGGQGSR